MSEWKNTDLKTGLLLLLIFGLPLTLLHAFAVSTLWRWFMVPIATVPELGLAQAYGLSILVGLLTAKSDMLTEQDYTKIYGRYTAYPLIALGFGWIALQFVGAS